MVKFLITWIPPTRNLGSIAHKLRQISHHCAKSCVCPFLTIFTWPWIFVDMVTKKVFQSRLILVTIYVVKRFTLPSMENSKYGKKKGGWKSSCNIKLLLLFHLPLLLECECKTKCRKVGLPTSSPDSYTPYPHLRSLQSWGANGP